MISILKTAERAGDFSDVHNYVMGRHIYAYILAKAYVNGTVLELGCGNGYGMKLLAGNCRSYTGVDKYMPLKFDLAENTAMFSSKLPNLTNIGSNLYDIVICFQVIEHIKDDKKLVEEIKRILKPGGRLLLTTPNINMSLTRNPYHIREYNVESMKKIIETQFSEFDINGIYGNEKVMDYYEENKKTVAKIMKWDVLKLQYLLPAQLLRLPYNILNNLNRILLFQKNRNDVHQIDFTDFYNDRVTDECLDFFVVATK